MNMTEEMAMQYTRGYIDRFKEGKATFEPKPCDDAISRDAVLEKAVYTETEEGWSGYTVDVDYIKSLPSVKPQEPKTGRWINIEDRTDWYDAAYKCSCCGREIITPYELKNNLYSDYPYCHCGAKMVDPQEGANE